MGKYRLRCLRCGAFQEEGFHPRCSQCDSLTETVYDLGRAKLYDSPNPFERFFDLLPVRDPALLPTADEYSPTVHARRLGEKLGLSSVYFKNETVHPSGTTKYRMAAVALAYLYENGVRHFCTSSTGNSSTAYAMLITRFPEMRMTLFTAGDFEERVNYGASEQVEHRVVENASFAAAFVLAADYAREHGLTVERGFFNPGRREGLKLAFCEATDQVGGPIDWYVQAVSSGMGVYGTYQAARELQGMGHIDRLPHLLCVQQESCAPMARAWMEGCSQIETRHIVEHPMGIAKAILRGDPSGVYPYMREIVSDSDGEMRLVSEDEIRRARQWVMDLEGIEICFAAAAAVAGMIRANQEGRIEEDAVVLVNLTGRDRA